MERKRHISAEGKGLDGVIIVTELVSCPFNCMLSLFPPQRKLRGSFQGTLLLLTCSTHSSPVTVMERVSRTGFGVRTGSLVELECVRGPFPGSLELPQTKFSIIVVTQLAPGIVYMLQLS